MPKALTGWTQNEAQGLPLEEVFRIVSESTREAVESPVSRVLREGKATGLPDHTVLVARDGTERPIDDSGAPIRGANGEIVGVVLVFRDVTARRQAEQARERLLRAEAAREAAVRANEAKDQFLALVSHELRSPLAAIRGWLHLLDSGFVPQSEMRGALQRIYRNTRLQERLVSDLLDISRITAGKLEVIRSPVDLVRIAQAAIDGCSSLAEQRGVALVLEQREPRLFVLGDEQRLIQSVANLVGNGIKFTRSGGSVVVRVERLDDNAVVTVSDTGIGMAPRGPRTAVREVLASGQLEGARARRPGTRPRHHQALDRRARWHDPSSQRGSRVRIDVHDQAAAAGRRLGRQGSPTSPAGDTKDLTGVHILLVDDDQDAQGRDADPSAGARRQSRRGRLGARRRSGSSKPSVSVGGRERYRDAR